MDKLPPIFRVIYPGRRDDKTVQIKLALALHVGQAPRYNGSYARRPYIKWDQKRFYSKITGFI